VGSAEGRICEVGHERLLQAGWVGGVVQTACDTVSHKFGVAPNPSRHYWQSGGHGLEYGVGNAFAERGQDEAIESAHEVGNIVAFTWQPGEFG